MAEIHVQRKRRNLWWLWLLVILIIAAVIYYLYTNNYFNTGNVNVMILSPQDMLKQTVGSFSLV
ncbi:MAG TPA: hypothetical protein VLZ28_06350 [Daejeonella sp.]|nr:hypothetical protein [Daejeonella sp.]